MIMLNNCLRRNKILLDLCQAEASPLREQINWALGVGVKVCESIFLILEEVSPGPDLPYIRIGLAQTDLVEGSTVSVFEGDELLEIDLQNMCNKFTCPFRCDKSMYFRVFTAMCLQKRQNKNIKEKDQ